MKVDKASRTAQYMAFFRALESTRAEGKRLFYDPYAIIFLDNGLRRAVKYSTIPPVRNYLRYRIHKMLPGGFTSGVARTKYIDDLLQSAVNNGVKQVIILGAGFDTRAIRLEFLHKVPVIEIDHPNTAKQKLGALQASLGKLPGNVRYYQIDFNEQRLEDLAQVRNIDLTIPTAIIWEGVSNYLSDQAVDNTFKFFSRFAKGSCLIFTYIHQQVLDDPKSFFGAEKLLNDLAEIEEHWTFGFDPEELRVSYCKKFGCSIVEDKGAVEYREHYMPDRPERGYEFYRVAMAVKD